MTEFASDLANVRTDIESSRAVLLSVLQGLQEADLDRRRRGGWSVKDILLHVIGGERHYVAGIAAIRELSARTSPGGLGALTSAEDAIRMLAETRLAALDAIDGIDEDSFYRLQPLTNEEGQGQTYSVLSVLENISLHDREHAAQIQAILAGRQAGT